MRSHSASAQWLHVQREVLPEGSKPSRELIQRQHGSTVVRRHPLTGSQEFAVDGEIALRRKHPVCHV
jgi:hypothetical protein